MNKLMEQKLIQIMFEEVNVLIDQCNTRIISQYTCVIIKNNTIDRAFVEFAGTGYDAVKVCKFLQSYIDTKGQRWAEENGSCGSAFVSQLANMKYSQWEPEFKVYEHYLRMKWLLWFRKQALYDVHELG